MGRESTGNGQARRAKAPGVVRIHLQKRGKVRLKGGKGVWVLRCK
jgi:hypothetical protein